MRRIVAITLPLVLAISCSQSDQPPNTNPATGDVTQRQSDDPLIRDFTDSEWERVHRCADALERQPQKAIPLLIRLLDRDENVKLQNTADLIYPGAETFYGHGGIINYDLDWLSVRAGWLLEEITFQDFGFSEHGIDHDKLLSAVVAGVRDVPLGDVAEINSDTTQRKERRSEAVARAKAWWRSNHTNWTRLSALSDALRSENFHCVLNALRWLRFGESPIEGFSRELYVKDIYPVVQRLAKSQDDEISSQAGLLISEKR